MILNNNHKKNKRIQVIKPRMVRGGKDNQHKMLGKMNEAQVDLIQPKCSYFSWWHKSHIKPFSLQKKNSKPKKKESKLENQKWRNDKVINFTKKIKKNCKQIH